MSKYPVEVGDMDGVINGVNYLLSGPAGLGQNFSGKSFNTTDKLSASARGPYILPPSTGYSVYVPPIDLSTSQMLDEVTYKFTFLTDQGTPPFYLGQPVWVQGVSNDTYNQRFNPIGVVECTSSYVIVKSLYPTDVASIGTGGTIYLTITDFPVVTDCQARVTVTGASDRVFLSGQIKFTFSYNCVEDATLIVTTAIVRTKMIDAINEDPFSVSTIFTQDETYTLTSGESNTVTLNSIFTSFIDEDYQGVTPDKGNYNYSLNITFFAIPVNPPTVTDVVIIDQLTAGTRTLTAQVVKQ